MRDYNEVYERLEKLIAILGADQVAKEVLNYFGSDDTDKFVVSVAGDYDVEL